jgi:hypothetical protein
VIDQYVESVLIFLGINVMLALSPILPVSAGYHFDSNTIALFPPS